VQGANPNAQERRAEMLEEMRKAETVRDALLDLDRITKSYPRGHEMRTRLESMDVQRVLDAVEEDISTSREALLHPRGS
jgi:bacterioferritin (cytochrome b1)